MTAAAWQLPEQEPDMRGLHLIFTFFLQVFFNETAENGPHIDPLGGATADEGPNIDPWG
jgi:hypothetical protein